MFDNTNPYTLRTKIIEGITHYYISFSDGQAIPRETEVNRDVYLLIDECRKHEKRQRNFYERHIALHELSDEHIIERTIHIPKSVEEIVVDEEQSRALNAEIAKLPEIQRRRFVLHHEFGLTYEQIAEMDGCKRQPVARSVERAEAKIREALKNFKK